MKKSIKLISALFLFMLLPTFVYADCPDEIINHFKEIEDEYQITYEFNKETENYNIKIHNPEPSSFLFISVNDDVYEKCSDFKTNDVSCENIVPQNYIFAIASTDSTCDTALKTIRLELSKKNNYWNDPLCEGIEEFVLCDPTYDKEISYEEFKSRIDTYKKTEIKKETPEEKNDQNDNKVIEYLGNNYQILSIIIALSMALVLMIVLIAKNLKKSRRLE